MFKFGEMFGSSKKVEQKPVEGQTEEQVVDGEMLVAHDDLQDGEMIKPIDINTGKEIEDLKDAA
jgi:hypothetical protein